MGRDRYDALKEKYIRTIVRKALKEWLDFFDGVEALVKSGAAEEVSYHMNYNKASAKKWVDKFTLREIQKQADGLRKKITKQFVSAPSSALFSSIWEAVAEEYLAQFDRFAHLLSVSYNDAIHFDMVRHDIAAIFY